MSKKSISVSEYNKLRSNENATSSRSMTKSDYDNLRSNKGTAVPLSVNGKDYGKISANAYNAIRYNNLDVYTPTNDAEKSIIDSYIKDNFKDNKGNTLATSLDDYKKKVEQAQTQAEEKTGFGKWLGSQALAGLATFNKGVAATLDFILPTEFLGKYDYISKMNDYYSNQHDLYQQAAAKTSVSRGKGWKTAGDVISGTVAALPNAILAFMSGGTSLGASGGATLATGASSASSTAAMVGQAVKTMAKNPMYWTSALQTLGTDYEEAKERGANDFVAASTAIITTALNAGIEVGGGIETLPKNLKTGGKNAVFEWVKSSLDEGKEEVLQGITTNAMAKLMYDKNAPLVSLTDDNAVLNPIKSAQEFAMGAAVGGILGGGQIATQSAVNTVSYTRTGKFFKDPDTVQAIIDTGLESPKDSRSYKLAVKANSKKGNLSNYEIGRLYYANVEQIVNEESNNAEDVTNETNTTIEASETDLNSDVNNNVGTVNTTVQVSSPEAASTTAETEQSNKTDEQTQSKVKAPVVVGDTFYDTKTGTTLTVVNRGENNTVVRVNESGIEKTYTNDVADMITSNPAFEKVDSTSTPETTAATNSETALPDANTAQDNQSNQSAETVTMTDGTIVRRVGDFYEAYGSEAEALAQKLDLTVTSKVVDGVKTPMVGFPVNLLDTYNSRLNAVTSINEQNMPVSSENTPVNEAVTNIDVDMAEGEILSLKHTKNVYSLFKGALRIVVGKDIITDGFVVLPLTDESLAGVKKVIGDSAPIQENPNFDMKKFYHADNDVIIQGNPKVGEATAGNKTVKAYTFKIADAFYSCQQKFIDAFNNGKNVIKANKSNNIPWTVHNENGELVALFLGLRANVTEENYNQMLTVADIKSAEQQKKAKQSFNPSEVKTIVKGSGIPRVFEMDGSKYVTEGHFALRTDDAGIAQLNGTVIPYHSMPDGMQTIPSDAVKKLLDSSYSVDVGELTLYTPESEKDAKTPPYYAFVADGIAHQYSKKFVDALKKRSTSMKLTSGGTLNSTLIVGYDADGNVTGFVLPVYANGNSYIDKDGNKIPFATNDNLKNLVKDSKDVSATAAPSVTEDVESGIKSDKTVTETPESVTEPTESVIKKADSVTETPENEKITVGMSDDARAELLNKKSVNVVSFDAEKTKALDDVDFDALQKTFTKYAKPIIEKVANDFGIINKTYFNPDIELDFEYSKGSLKESINKQHTMYGDFIKMLSVFSDVISNAVGVETHEDKYKGTIREDTTLKQMYVLASALRDETGIIPVKLEVKEFNEKANKLYLSVVLTKKESRYLHGNLGQNQLNTATPAFTISIADLVGIVNPSEGDFLKYFPDSMLDSEQIEGKNKALAKDAERIEKLSEDKKRSLATAENANALSSTPETTSSTASIDSISQEAENVNTSEEIVDTPTLTDKCEMYETTHTKTGEALWVISLNDKISSDEYKALSAAVKKVGGYYSRFAKTPDGKAIPGFIFKSEPDADVINTFNSFFGTETTEETIPAETKSGAKEIDTEALLGAVENTKVGDEIKLADHEKAETGEQGLNNEPENDTMVSEKVKEDFKVGDIISVNGKQWRVTSTDFTMTFENLDKNDSEATFQHIGGMDSFKDTHDYTVIKESAENVHDGILGRKGENDNSVRKSEPVSEAKEKRQIGTADRELGENVADESGTGVQAPETDTSSTGQLDSGNRNDRVRESDDGTRDSGTGIVGNDNVDVETSESSTKKSKDFVITKAVAENIDTANPSMDDNIKAIETLRDIEASGKAPTKAQQGILAKFKGWGGLAGSFYGANKTKLQEFMSDDEIRAAQSTVNDAYFTPTTIIDSIYKALNHIGFEGGNVLEPSMGVGNFFGRMPKAVKDNSNLFGVEIDSISGRIAQQLYPSANIEIAPFQDVAYKDGAFDLIIGNVPFGEVKYKYKNKKYLIHDYFFVKAMDKLNDGGILAFLTTKGTLDKLDSTTRAELANQGKLIGAYRLPSNVFSKSAGANVVTDLIIMQKSTDKDGESFVNLSSVPVGVDTFSINEYFANHPENIIGELTTRKDWRSGKTELDVRATGNTAEQLVKVIKKLPKNLISGVQTVGTVNVTENTARMQTFTVTEKDVVEYVDVSTGEVKQIKGKNAITAKEYIKLKEAYQDLVDTTLSGNSTEVIESKRKALNTVYDGFVKKHGTLEKNKKLLSVDNDFYKMSGLEVYDTKTKKTVKSEMFTKDTLGKRKPKKADSVLDALSISIGETGTVDLNRIAGLTGLTEDEAAEQLSDRIVYTPDGEYELNEVYLSGNVREKYEAVKGKKGFEKNAQMLEAIIPEDITAKNITPQFGSPWIKPDYVADFLTELLNLRYKPTVNYDPTTGTWSVSGNTWGDHTLLTKKYGTAYMDAMSIAEKALNMRRIVVTDKDKKILVGETRAAQQKAEDIKAAFEEWCFKDADRRKDLVKTFNEKFNSNRNMDFSELAKYLTFDGLSDTFKLRDYQKRAVARAVFNGNTLLAHGVGTGKTAEMIAIAMELKRMGIAKKNMMVVPNHKVADFRNDILKMYPSAKVAAIKTGANPTERQRFYALVASNDFDIVIIPHSSFGMLDVSAETKRAFINNQIYELEEVLTAAQEEKGKIDGRFIRTLENQKKRLEEKLKFVTESAKDSGNTFEELGVDSLFVDEAHNFKNLPFYSKLSRVAGVSVKQSNNKTRASRAENMFMITDYLNRNDGRIVFGTATPITNSMSEIYNMTRFLRPDILEEAGIQSFDAWASMFGSIVNQAEVDPSGRNMRMKERFSKFKNVSQMVEQFRRMADILKTGDVIQELPKAERINVTNKPNDIQEEFLDIIDDMIDEVRSKGQRAEHNMLEITKAGQMAAIDLRFVKSYFNGKYTDDDLNLPNNRTSQVAQKVYKEYVESNATKGTQFVFCDEGVYDDPNKKYNFYVYGDLINKLVNLGIPREEIAIAQEFEDKADLSAKVNTGEIRVLIGSTAVMGEGMNAQQKAVALHHMTVPYRPSDIEQREGRIIRFGNENKNVRIYRYIQEGSYDSYQWQMQERKANFINQALSGGTVEELEEMSDFQLSAREAKAIASGNPLLLEKIEIEDKLNKLKSIRSKFNTDKLEMQDRLATLPKRIAQKEKAVSTTAADVKTIKGNATEDFEITLGKTKYTERAKAAEALKKGLVKAPRNGSMLKIGAYRGLDLYYTSSFDKGTHYVLKGEGEYSVLGGESASGNITRIINLAEKIGETIETDKQMLENYKTEIETLKKEIDSEFPQTKELEDLQAKLNEIDTQLGINVDTVDMSEVIVADEVEDDVQSSRDLASGNSAERWTTERVDGNEGKGVNLADIVRSISKKFDIPIATGKVTDSEASGAYKRKAETIRTRIANNLPTISHELGHHLDKDYDFSNMESVELLKSSIPAEFFEQYEEADRSREAVAEFVRTYLKNTNDANRLCPEFYADFISTLSKEDLKSLNEIAASVNEYLSYNISERYDAAITTSKKQEKLSFKEKWQRLYTSWVDAFHPQKEAVDYVEEVTGRTLSGKGNAYVLATNSLNAHTIANYLICEGFRDLDGNVVDAKSFVDSIGMVDSKNVSLLDKYLVLRHSLEWIAPTESDVAPKRVFADDTLENVEEIEKQIAQIEAEHPEIKTAAENLYEYQNNVLRHFVIPAGGMSEETLDMLNRKYPSYVPFYRAVGKKSGMAKGTFVNQRSPIMRAKGSGALILSPVESIIRNTEKMVKLALRNQTAKVLSSYADTVDGFGQFMEAIPPDMIPHSVNIVKSKETFTDALQQIVSSGEDYFAVSDLFEQIFGNEVTDFTPVANANKRIVTVLQDGRPTYYQIHDEALYNAVAELAPQQANGYVKWATKIMQPMKLLITQNNPIFAVTNAIRDFGTAYKLSEVNNLAVFAAQYVKALGGIITNNADYKRYKAMGGGHSSELSANIDNIARTLRTVAHKDMGKARRLAYSLFVHPVETVAMFNDAIESVPRFAEFQRTLKDGGDLQEAIFNASDITTNFKRSGGGVGVKIANSTFMFNNAAIQGIDKTFRTLTNKDTKKRYRTLLKWLLHALLMGIIGYIYNKEVDEEGYKNLSSYKKNNFYNFAIGDGKFISLPKPRENALLDTFTERAIEYAFGNENAFYDFSTYLGGQLIPPMIPDDLKSIEDAAHSWLGGTVLGGIVDVGFNQDFKDTPIESAYDIYTPSNERYTESTTKFAYTLGQTKLARNMDMSPKKIDHLLSSYTGILGQINKALFPMNEEHKDTSIGLRNKFISDSNYSTDVLNRMYENQEKAEKAFQYSGTIDTAIEYEKNSIITSYISGMNKAVKALPKDEQRSGRAYLLKALNSWNYDDSTSQLSMLSSLDGSTVSKDVIFNELPSSSLEWTVDKQKYVYQMTPQEYHKYISDYLTVIENARRHYGGSTVESYEAAKEAAKKYMSDYKKNVLKRKYITKATAKTE